MINTAVIDTAATEQAVPAFQRRTAALTALVIHPDAQIRRSVTAELEAAGLAVVSRSSGLMAPVEMTPDIILLDVDGPTSSAIDTLRLLNGDQYAAGTPVVGLTSISGMPDMSTGFAAGIADYAIAPFFGPAFVHRITTVLARFGQLRIARQGAERLREQARAILVAVRSTNDPAAMAAHMVAGLGETFGADRVWLHVFEDSRVPHLTAEWNRPGLSAVELPWEEAGGPTQHLADRLWSSTKALAVDDHADRQELPDGAELAEGVCAPEVLASLAVPLGEGKAAFGIVWLLMTDGPRMWTTAEVTLVQQVCGNLEHALVQGHLITGQQSVMERLLELDKAKSDFVATVNHELRTPLTSITGYLDMVRDGAGGPVPPAALAMLDIVDRNANRLRQLIEDMLTISRMDSVADEVTSTEVNVGTLLTAVVAALQPIAAAKRVSLECDYSEGSLLVGGDAAALEQVFTNVVSNAVKFTPALGRVVVVGRQTAAADGSAAVTIDVSDTGIGIPESDLPKLFGRFFRATNASAAAIPGTGLGLAIARGIVVRHGGDVSVKSKVGSGTTMSVTLPAATPTG
ncbi:histidine kinase [Paeniglutamicibacter antarcticus]|uniref:histidine kinase n=1 Tax=Arthrobacter terrae TaxID=2935737 RepID=A0A931CP00_9MICC|nr:ATP-binding protein [Arthrobacter terrae]MBG0738354.1 histidine kinase [Arthrobacter terrae]